MSTEIEGRSCDLRLSIEPAGTLAIGCRAIARLETLDFVREVVGFPFELWAGVVSPSPNLLPGFYPTSFLTDRDETNS